VNEALSGFYECSVTAIGKFGILSGGLYRRFVMSGTPVANETSKLAVIGTRWATALAAGVWLALVAYTAGKTVSDPANHSVFPLFYDSSRAWWDGVNVYDRNVFAGDYRYGPTFAMVMGLIAWLPLTASALVFAALNIAVTLWAIIALSRRLLPGLDGRGARPLFVALTAVPCAHGLLASQPNLLIFGLAAFAAIAVLDRRWWSAALYLAIPIHIKVWPIAGAMLMASCWPRKLTARLIVCVAAVAALPVLAKPAATVMQQYIEWFSYLLGPAQHRHTYRDMWTLWELAGKSLSSGNYQVNPKAYIAVQLVSALAAFALCMRQVFRGASPERRLLVVMVAWTTWQLLFGPGTERNTFGLIAPLSSWALIVSITSRKHRWLMLISFMAMIAGSSGLVEKLLLPTSNWFVVLHPLGVFGFLAWFVIWNGATADEDIPAAKNTPCGQLAWQEKESIVSMGFSPRM
jgi:hypothetical protein